MIGKLRFALLLAVIIATSPAHGQDSFQAFRQALIDYFEPQGYLPVIVDRGYRIGDVVNIDGVNLYARAGRCFPHLKQPTGVKTSLPDVVHAFDIGMSFGLRLIKLFNSSAGADLVRRVEIRFTDITTTSVPLLDLRDALDRAACPDIAPLVDGTLLSIAPGDTTFFVVSELLTGKREARLEFSTRADLEVKTKDIARQVGDASLDVRGSNDGSVTLRSEIASSIAMKPVTIPKIVTVRSFEGIRGGEESKKVKWQPLECRQERECSQQLSAFADLVRASIPRLSMEDLGR